MRWEGSSAAASGASQLSENGTDVLTAAADVLRAEHAKGSSGSLSGDLEAKRRALALSKDKTPANGNN